MSAEPIPINARLSELSEAFGQTCEAAVELDVQALVAALRRLEDSAREWRLEWEPE